MYFNDSKTLVLGPFWENLTVVELNAISVLLEEAHDLENKQTRRLEDYEWARKLAHES